MPIKCPYKSDTDCIYTVKSNKDKLNFVSPCFDCFLYDQVSDSLKGCFNRTTLIVTSIIIIGILLIALL